VSAIRDRVPVGQQHSALIDRSEKPFAFIPSEKPTWPAPGSGSRPAARRSARASSTGWSGWISTIAAAIDFLDGSIVTQINVAWPYFDGDTPGASWTGTAQASTSTIPIASGSSQTLYEYLIDWLGDDYADPSADVSARVTDEAVQIGYGRDSARAVSPNSPGDASYARQRHAVRPSCWPITRSRACWSRPAARVASREIRKSLPHARSDFGKPPSSRQ